MPAHALRLRTFAFLAGVALLGFSGWASADPPSRVARLGYLAGAVSFSPAGENDWVEATINRPLTAGDRLWADARARTEIQVGGARIRMNADTGVTVVNLDDRIGQLQLTQGTLNVSVRRFEPDELFEVDTPNLAFTLRQPGEFRIEVDPEGNATTIIVRKGRGEVYGEGAAYLVDSRQSYRFMGTGLRDYEYVGAPRLDEFDQWSGGRDRAFDNSVSARYVSQDVVGYQDLDGNGTWRVDASYGNVWVPNRVAAGWAPYRDGHWAWVDPWGWTWVDDAPWGFAVSHYGRWTNLRGTWGWVPGPTRTRAYYAPALVAFVGGNNFQLSISSGNIAGVAWFPLAPHEVYRPSYASSRGYFEKVNRSNTVINSTVINNSYNTTNVTKVVYANRHVPGAVIAVPRTVFVQSQPVSRAAVRVPRELVASAPVVVAPHEVPTEHSVHGAAALRDRPPGHVFERPVVAHSAPPAAHVGFAAQQQQLTAKPGHPLDEPARKELKPAAAAPLPAVRVLTRTQEAPPTVRPPPTALGGKLGDTRGKSEPRGNGEQRGQPVVAPAVAAPPKGAVPTPIAQSPEPRGKSGERGKSEQRGQPATSPAVAAPPKIVAPAWVAQPPEPRDKSEPRDKGNQRGKSEQPDKGGQRGPAAEPQGAAQPKAVAPPQVAPPAPVAQHAAKPARPEPAARQAEPPPAAAAPRILPPEPQAAPKAKPQDRELKPGADVRKERKDEAGDQKPKREDERGKG